MRKTKFSPPRVRNFKFASSKDAAFALALFAVLPFIPQIIQFVQQHPIQTVLLATVLIAIVTLIIIRKKCAKRAITLANVDNMTGGQFEEYLEILFRNQGYRVRRIGGAGDQGADLILSNHNERIICQAKRYKRPVSNHAVQQAVAAINHYKCDRAIVVTNSTFTVGARELAKSNRVVLIDRECLGKLIMRFSTDSGNICKWFR